VIGAGAPILVSLAALPGWSSPLWVVGLFVVLELFTNLVLETVLYAGAAGVSQVALLVSLAFWTWLWGPLGLLMATPLTVCLVVLGKHVPGLEFVGMLMADTPALAPEFSYYQLLLARDQSEAADLIEQHIKTQAPLSVYDALLLPALNYAERDRLEQRLSVDEETAVIDATRELLSDAAELIRRLQPEPPAPDDQALPGLREPLRVMGLAINGVADEMALEMPGHLLSICRSSWRSPRGACSPRNSCRWYKSKGSRLSASLICRPALRLRHAISSSGSTPRCPRCESWSDAGARRRWRTTAHSCCGMQARLLWPQRSLRPGLTWAGWSKFRVSRFRQTASKRPNDERCQEEGLRNEQSSGASAQRKAGVTCGTIGSRRRDCRDERVGVIAERS
jgi:hypothetical protein